ncbi:hypothetical protein FRC12_001816 [Ceratobasidium sp. 428]|nr:hypothetical protein FRC12_001816 [Ceratobasidium sp. 428]
MSPYNIFGLQEPTGIILDYMDTNDRARLAGCNNQLFYMLMPSLWERVEGLARLFALSPYLDLMSGKNHTLYTTSEIEQFVASQRPLDDKDLVRFDVYSPWIKHLEVCKHGSAPEYDGALALLYIYSQSRAILPNITFISLTVQLYSRANPISVIPFLSSSLLGLEFSLTDSLYHSNISMAESAILLSLVSARCPQLKTLGFTPQDVNYPQSYRSETSLLRTLTQIIDQSLEEKLGHYLGYFITPFQPLVRFTSSVNILDVSSFGLVSTWPCLESFEILFDGELLELPSFSDTAFPVLTHLGLHQVPDWTTLEDVWDNPAIVSKLTSIKLDVAESCSDFESDPVDEIILAFSILGTRSPHTQNLWLHVENPDDYSYVMSTSDLDQLGSLPLHSLHLGGISFKRPEDIPRYIATTFPGIKELGLPNHLIKLNELQVFRSELPLLEVLRIKFKLKTISPDFEVDLSDVPRHRNIPLHTLEANFIGSREEETRLDIFSMEYSNAKALSSYLFTLWPNIQITAQGACQYIPEFYRYLKLMALINDHLARLSYCNRDSLIQYQSIHALNEDSWEDCKR